MNTISKYIENGAILASYCSNCGAKVSEYETDDAGRPTSCIFDYEDEHVCEEEEDEAYEEIEYEEEDDTPPCDEYADSVVSKYKSQIRYDKKNTIQLKFKLNVKTDEDIIHFLNTSGNKQGVFKEAIRNYMFQESGEEKNLKWAVVDEAGVDNFLDVYHSKQAALSAAKAEWEHLSEYDQDKREAFYVGLVNVEYRNGSWDYAELPGGIIDADVYEIAKKYK